MTKAGVMRLLAKIGRGITVASLCAIGCALAVAILWSPEVLPALTTQGRVEKIEDSKVVVSFSIDGRHQTQSFPVKDLHSVPRMGDPINVHYVPGRFGPRFVYLEGDRWQTVGSLRSIMVFVYILLFAGGLLWVVAAIADSRKRQKEGASPLPEKGNVDSKTS
jgi:hypothetical protein